MGRILITGASGLIGTAAASILERNGHQIIGMDIKPRTKQQVRADVRSIENMSSLATKVDGIVHLAAISRVVDAQNDPVSCFNTNVAGLNNVFTAAVNSPSQPWVIFASSREVYGDQDILPVHEDAKLKPMNVYANSKVAGEQIARTAAFCGIHTAIVRFSNVYGSVNDHNTRVIPAFVRAALSGQTLRIEGGENTFDFVHVEDAAKGLVAVCEQMFQEKTSLPPIHFVSGRGTTLSELAQAVIEIVGTGNIKHFPPRNFDVSKFYGNPLRAKEILGWEAKINLESGLHVFSREMNAHLTGGAPERHIIPAKCVLDSLAVGAG